MAGLFLDTGFLIALEAADDQNHTEATAYWQMLIPTLPALVTTSYVFDETVTFFNSRDRHEKAVEIGERLINSRLVELISVDDDLFNAGWQYMKRHADKRYSLTDCLSFVVMEQRNISRALSFDRHFIQAGFVLLPQ